MKPTHVIKFYPSNNAEVLFRTSDGMMIGKRQDITVIIGEDPNKAIGRVFIDKDRASEYLRMKVATDDFKANPQNGDAFNLEAVDAESLVLMPGEVVGIPGTGSIRKMN